MKIHLHWAALATSCLLLAAASSVTAESDALRALKLERVQLLERLNRAEQDTPYIVIDTRDNELILKSEDHQTLRVAVCATGAARKLEGPKRKHKWEFSTPTGRFSLLRKVADPIWTKPEWVFVEAGEEIPIFAEDRRRFQRGVLGEYALYFAKDYMIHGTLYEINLGKSITHGCIRVSSSDLSYLYREVDVGWPVYIY